MRTSRHRSARSASRGRRGPALVLAAFAAVAGPAAVRAQAPSVSGVVQDESGRPLAHATVALHPLPTHLERGRLLLAGRSHPEPAARSRTDAEGRFRIEAPEVGFWSVVVRHPERVPMERSLAPLLASVDLEPVRLLRDAGLAVRVVDDAGKSVPGVALAFRGTGPAAVPDPVGGGFGRDWHPLRRPAAVTGDDGRATLPRFAGEAGRLHAVAPGRTATAEVGDVAGRARARVVLAAGATRLLRARTATGVPAAGAVVWTEGPLPAGLTADDGTLAVPLPEGEPVRVQLDAPDGRVGDAEVALPTGEDRGPVEVVLEAPPEVAGRVLEAGTRRGLAGALVWATSDPAAAARSGRGGAFRLPALWRPGGVALAAAAPGYRQTGVPVRDRGEVPEEPVVLVLAPSVRLAGVVEDETGRGLPWAEVRVLPGGSHFMGHGQGAGGRFARSGDDGRFAVEGLPADVVHGVYVTLEGYAPHREELAPADAGHGAEPGEAAAAGLPELRVVLSASHRLRGRLVDEAGQPVGGAEVVLLPEGEGLPFGGLGPAGMARATTGADGDFELGDLIPGRAALAVHADGRAPFYRPGVAVPRGPGVTDLGDLVLEAEAVLEGVVEDPRGAPVTGAKVSVSPANRAGRRGLAFGFAGGGATAETGADGRFRIGGLSAGELVEVSVHKEGYPRRQEAGIRVPDDGPVRIVLEAGAVLAGRVVDGSGRPVADATVHPSSAARWTGGGFRGRTDGDGRFLLEGVRPGAVELQAMAEGHRPSAPVSLEVEAGERRDRIELVLRDATSLRGRVLSPDGLPVEGAMVTGRATTTPGASRGVTSDGAGRFTLELEPGRVVVEASKEGYAPEARDLELGPEGATVDLRLGRGAAVSGRVLRPDGSPAASQRLHLSAPGDFGRPQRGEVSGADGAFAFHGVADGTYRLEVVGPAGDPWPRSGSYVHPEQVVVEGGAPVPGIVVRLPVRTTLRGRLLGVEPGELADVSLSAERLDAGAHLRGRGEVLDGGRYRIRDLDAGEWRVSASIAGSGKLARATVEIASGQEEAYLDLELREGVAVTGTVLWNGEPAAGARVVATHLASGQLPPAITDRDGRFRLVGVEPGTLSLFLALAEHRAWTSRTVEIQGGEDLLLEIETTRVRGTVLSATGLGPLAEARIRLEPDVSAAARVRPMPPPVTSAVDGRFLFESVEPGRYRLHVEKSGFAAQTVPVEVAGGEVEVPPVALEPAEGLELRVVGADGGSVGYLTVIARGADGVPLVQTVLGGGATGRFHLETLPPGRWDLVLAAPGRAAVSVAAVSPGPPVEVILPLEAVLELSVPELAGEGAPARVAVTDPSGRPAPRLAASPQMGMLAGQARIGGLTAGTWTVTVTAADGRSWSGTVAVEAGTTKRVELR